MLGEDTVFGRLYYQATDYLSLQGEVHRLQDVLDQLANGSHLDAARNHDDDSLREIAGCCTCGQRNRLLKHAGRVAAALAASTGQEVGK